MKLNGRYLVALALAAFASGCGGDGPAPALQPAVQASTVHATRAETLVNLLTNPGFEADGTGWLLSNGSYAIVTADAARAHGGSKFAWLGGYDNAADTVAQDVTISDRSTQASLQFWYAITTKETSASMAYDSLRLEVLNPVTGARLALLKTYTNLDAAGVWVQSARFDLSAYRGQTVRVQFSATTDGSETTSFLIDDLQVNATQPSPWPATATLFDGATPPIFSGNRSDYNLTVNADSSVTVVDRSGGGGIQVYSKVKRMGFADGAVDFDQDGNSGQIYRLYQSVFNRQPDSGGLGYWTEKLDTGILTYTQVANAMIGSPEFISRYGSLSNSQFVVQLYANVLRRLPDAGGLAWHVGHLDGTNPDGARLSRLDVLATFSESPENKALVSPALQLGIAYQAFDGGRTVCAAGTVKLNGVCGKIAPGCTRPQVLENGLCRIPAPGLTISAVGSNNANDAAAVVSTRSGSTMAYFTAPGSRLPTQALLTNPDGSSARVFYGPNGALQKIVDPLSGKYVSVRIRSDVQGADYLLFDKLGTFVSGHTMYKTGSSWYTAPVVGDFGQFTGGFSGTVNGSFALKAAHLIYGTPVRLPEHLEQLLNGVPAGGTTFTSAMLDMLLPSAHAGLISAEDIATMRSGLAFVVGGALLGGPAAPLLIAGGVLQIGRGLLSNIDANLDNIDASVNNILLDRTANDLDSGSTPVDSAQNSLFGLLTGGINKIKSKVITTLNRVVGNIAGIVTPQVATDTSVAEKALPSARSDNTALVGTMVDSTNRIYNAYGTMDQAGEFTATGDSADSVRMNIAGKTLPAGTTTHRACTQSNALGTIGTCTVASSSKLVPVGACQTSSQSGGNGTFSYAYNLGKTEGSFTLSYDMYTIKDAMTVIGGGRTLFTTGGLVSGRRSMTLTYEGDASVIVNLSAPESGTQWTFTIGCGT